MLVCDICKGEDNVRYVHKIMCGEKQLLCKDLCLSCVDKELKKHGVVRSELNEWVARNGRY